MLAAICPAGCCRADTAAVRPTSIEPSHPDDRSYPWLFPFQSQIKERIVDLFTKLRQVHCEAFEVGKRAIGQRSLVSGAQDYARGLACLECFLPAGCT